MLADNVYSSGWYYKLNHVKFDENFNSLNTITLLC